MNEAWLAHHGIKGQKWGIRRFQNPDGSLTAAGRKRYNTLQEASNLANEYREYAKSDYENYKKSGDNRYAKIALGQMERYETIAKQYSDLSKRVGEIDKKTMKEAEKFIKKSFFTSADMGDYEFFGTKGNTEEDDNRVYASKPDFEKPKGGKNIPNKQPSNTQSFDQKRRDFMKTYKPPKGSPNSLLDIDDPDLIDMEIDDPDFRKEYGVSDSDYERWKKNVR